MAGWWGPSHCTRSCPPSLIFVQVLMSLLLLLLFCLGCWFSFTVPLDLGWISRRCGKILYTIKIKINRWEIYTTDILPNYNFFLPSTADGKKLGNHEPINRYVFFLLWPNFSIFDSHLKAIWTFTWPIAKKKLISDHLVSSRCTKQRDERKFGKIDWIIIRQSSVSDLLQVYFIRSKRKMYKDGVSPLSFSRVRNVYNPVNIWLFHAENFRPVKGTTTPCGREDLGQSW
jgi:hypothetical protein